MMFETYCLIFLAFGAFALFHLIRHHRNRMRMPPGPVGYPIIGNLLNMPKGTDPEFWAKYREIYGDTFIRVVIMELIKSNAGPMTSFSTFGSCVIILNDIKVVEDLFEKKSTIYSNRAPPTFLGKMYVKTLHVASSVI